MASRATLARRLRAVERALAGAEGVEFETGAGPRSPGTTDERIGSMDERLDAVEERTGALCRAVRALGEFLVARERARRTDECVESIQQAIRALPDTAHEDGRGDGNDRDDRVVVRGADASTAGTTGSDVVPGTLDPGTALDGTGAADGDESAAEWLDRVASGGVTPPPLE